MNKKQLDKAKNDMIEWLSHPGELGEAPCEIEFAESFLYDDMNYYIFKYRKDSNDSWLLSVAGGYEGDSLDHCGHIFSEMEDYIADRAKDDAIKIIEMIKEYYKNMAESAENRKENIGNFVGFTLLSKPEWDKDKFIKDLKEVWDIDVVEDREDKSDDTLVFSLDDTILSVGFVKAPVPNNEAVENAKNNFLWDKAVEVAENHKAHLIVAVIGKGEDLLEKGKYFTKLLSVSCRQENTCGIYTSGVVFEPKFYEDFSYMMKDNLLPIRNWIWFGLYQSTNGIGGYTYGMDVFGKDEMEVLDAKAEPREVLEFLADLVMYVLEYDVTLNNGETIGFSEDDKHSITKSDGVALPYKTLKIEY